MMDVVELGHRNFVVEFGRRNFGNDDRLMVLEPPIDFPLFEKIVIVLNSHGRKRIILGKKETNKKEKQYVSNVRSLLW